MHSVGDQTQPVWYSLLVTSELVPDARFTFTANHLGNEEIRIGVKRLHLSSANECKKVAHHGASDTHVCLNSRLLRVSAR